MGRALGRCGLDGQLGVGTVDGLGGVPSALVLGAPKLAIATISVLPIHKDVSCCGNFSRNALERTRIKTQSLRGVIQLAQA